MNWSCTDLILYEEHRKGVSVIGFFYACVNAYQTMSTGKPLYHFLTWEDYTSPIICMTIIGVMNLLFKAFILLTKHVKPNM